MHPRTKIPPPQDVNSVTSLNQKAGHKVFDPSKQKKIRLPTHIFKEYSLILYFYMKDDSKEYLKGKKPFGDFYQQ